MESSTSLGVRKGAWTAEEDLLLRECVEMYGEGKWRHVPLRAGLKRCRKSCRLRWLNYLRPNIKRGQFTVDEIDLILRLHKLLGNRQVRRWSLIAGRLPGRTANDVKNYWNTHLQKKLVSQSKEVKANTQETEEKKVIKPQPRTFSKNSLWLRRETTSVDTNQPGDIVAMSSTKFPPDDGTPWWENVLVGKEVEKETSCSIVGSGEDFFTGLWVEEMEATTKGGHTFVEEGKSEWDDLSFDVDLWS